MKKITFEELYERFVKHNEEKKVTSQYSASKSNRLVGVVVFKKENWPGNDYSLESRSYQFVSDIKYFIPGLGGNSIFADCMDGSEEGIRLDFYLSSWEIDYCYIEGE
jgi:hypothetical protein